MKTRKDFIDDYKSCDDPDVAAEIYDEFVLPFASKMTFCWGCCQDGPNISHNESSLPPCPKCGRDKLSTTLPV